MATITSVMGAIQDALENAYTGLDIPIQVFAGNNQRHDPPSIDFWPGDQVGTEESQGFGAVQGDEVVFTLRAFVNAADPDAGQDLLVQFIDDEEDLCIAHPLMDDPTLGGVASSVNVDPPSGYLRLDHEGGTLLGVQWRVVVMRLRAEGT